MTARSPDQDPATPAAARGDGRTPLRALLPLAPYALAYRGRIAAALVACCLPPAPRSRSRSRCGG